MLLFTQYFCSCLLLLFFLLSVSLCVMRSKWEAFGLHPGWLSVGGLSSVCLELFLMGLLLSFFCHKHPHRHFSCAIISCPVAKLPPKHVFTLHSHPRLADDSAQCHSDFPTTQDRKSLSASALLPQ